MALWHRLLCRLLGHKLSEHYPFPYPSTIVGPVKCIRCGYEGVDDDTRYLDTMVKAALDIVEIEHDRK